MLPGDFFDEGEGLFELNELAADEKFCLWTEAMHVNLMTEAVKLLALRALKNPQES
ncbi:hypothetical protein SLEP1_g50030 [Rubroshorea leprosula]|uniref:Uncharacterized protein n=1 Tax=Rubroshorea leprosula TaxID=152421 RepID=A0AAV5LYV3_9ROSI|nr:hypothetical protein SLEP1_g50030 [Rubroshorea leprosula]